MTTTQTTTGRAKLTPAGAAALAAATGSNAELADELTAWAADHPAPRFRETLLEVAARLRAVPPAAAGAEPSPKPAAPPASGAPGEEDVDYRLVLNMLDRIEGYPQTLRLTRRYIDALRTRLAAAERAGVALREDAERWRAFDRLTRVDGCGWSVSRPRSEGESFYVSFGFPMTREQAVAAAKAGGLGWAPTLADMLRNAAAALTPTAPSPDTEG